MTEFLGRSITMTWNAIVIGGVRQKGLSANGSPIDITSDDDAGWRTILSEAGQNEFNLSISGVTKDNAIEADWHAGDRQRAVLITYPNGDTLAFTGHLISYTNTGPYNDATTFAAEIQSTGPVVFTAV